MHIRSCVRPYMCVPIRVPICVPICVPTRASLCLNMRDFECPGTGVESPLTFEKKLKKKLAESLLRTLSTATCGHLASLPWSCSRYV